ncbi:hypothetical protein BCV69DRAFT_277042 [Microstroma glucosiphilum]|uniref:Uncharacterized protein n=1 Tax=Pseudomicrostroma glucosiphilum TaxID=1684307 RepID=A0A316U6K3_9BASI|nr:hypothetical protein BCV69DRAFT_277042 [Pseudomicrostroma glucosiphilum]PWN20876.1 hypothetical protein BCV69DRAFT_277042 [Pseudomicrostroma glucosiphilum]
MPYQPDFDQVYVKPYYETLYEALCCCLPGARRSAAKTGYERLLDQEEDEVEARVKGSGPLLRWIALLLSGQYLPDNLQLYAALHRFSGVLEGLRHANVLQPGSSDINDAGTSRVLSQSTKDLLENLAALSRDVARWLASDDAVVEVHQEGEETSVKRRIPSGNSRHQLQRVVYHTRRLIKGDAPPASVETQLTDVIPEVETVKRSAEQAAEDLRLAAYSMMQIVVVAVTSDQLTNAVRDVLNYIRDSAADVALEAAQEASAAESALRPSEEERQGTLKQEVQGLGSAAQDAAVTVTQLDYNLLAAKAEALPKDGANWAKEHTISGHDLGHKIADVAGELMEQDDSFREAVQHLLRLSSKYYEAVKTAADGKIPKEVTVTPSKPPPSSLDSELPAATINKDLVALLKALQELLEGLAGGQSLDPIVEEVSTLWKEVKYDVLKAFDDWAQKAQRQLLPKEGDNHSFGDTTQSSSFSDTLRELYESLYAIIKERPDLHAKWDNIYSLSIAFLNDIGRDARLLKLYSRTADIFQILWSVFDVQARRLTVVGKELMMDTYWKLVPSLLTIIGNVPLPRIEFTSPQVDAALDDLQVGAISLLPSRVRFEAKEVFEWNSVETSETQAAVQQTRLQASGLRLAVKQASFFFREKFTQVSSHWLNYICCALPRKEDQTTLSGREEEGHLGAYREQALLDLGLFGRAESLQGAEVTIDLGPAAKHDQTRFLHVNAATVSLSDSFGLRLRRSHHYIVNTLITEPILTPILRLVLEKVGSVLLEQGLHNIDERLYDVHLRANYLAHRSRQAEQANLQEYMRALMDKNAGKTPERLRKEKEEQQAVQQQSEREEQSRRLQARADVDVENQQPAKSKIEVKPMAIIVNPTEDISISIGAYPTLLPVSAQGPETKRIQLRNAVVEDEWRELARVRAVDTWNEVAHIGGAATKTAGDARETIAAATDGVKEAQTIAAKIDHVADEREQIEETRRADGEAEPDDGTDEGWRHDGFDL